MQQLHACPWLRRQSTAAAGARLPAHLSSVPLPPSDCPLLIMRLAALLITGLLLAGAADADGKKGRNEEEADKTKQGGTDHLVLFCNMTGTCHVS